ncbi:MAG: VanW family protein [Oscillospiraceae bacterium]|nr:VanW family protein [Oscillospiraceae bacterium]
MKQQSSKARKKTAAKKSKQNKKSVGAGGIIGAVIFAAIVLVLAVSIIGSLSWQTILPNVHAYGVDVGGMTVSEAKTAIRAKLEDPADGVRISFTGGAAMEFTIADTVSGYDAAAAAEKAWNYGRRSGSVIPLRFAMSFVGAREVFPAAANGINGEALRNSISKKAAAINSTLVEGAFSVNGSSLTIIKGASGVLLDEDEVYRCVRTAFEQGLHDIGYTPIENAPQPLTVDDIYAMVCREAHNAEFDEEFNVIKSVDGLTFDIERARSLYDEARDGAVITVTLSTIEPDITTEELSALLYRDELAQWTSTLTNNEVRSTNVELAAKAVDGTVLLPGEVFSFNDIVGERTEDRGFGPAAAYFGGETVYEVGGGICQVSSSVYYCALLANMSIIERTCHLYTASYVPLGMDSTVSWGGPEFMFENSSEYPIKITARREGNRLYCSVYGTKVDDTYVEMDYEIVETYAFDTVYEEDESVSPGRTKTKTSGITGYKVITYRTLFAADGSVISRTEEDVSIYSKRDQVVLVAPGELALYDPSAKPTEEPITPTPTPASGSNLGGY